MDKTIKMPRSHRKKTENTQNQEASPTEDASSSSVTEQGLMENKCEESSELGFRRWIIRNLCELKEYVLNQCKETNNFEKRFDEMLTRMDNLEKNINELMELKNTIREIREVCTSFNCRIDQVEERILEVEDQLNEMKREDKIREKRVKRNEQNLQEIWDYVKRPNLRLIVSVGYEYESCLDLTLWEKRTAILQGYELDASNMGGWTLDKHHVLDVQNGILYKGNGENQFISQQPPVVSSIMGNGRRRSISCPSCNGQADGNKLLAPVALACGIDGSLYVGDFNYVRRIFPSGNVTSVLELSSNPAHRYYLATDPVTGDLYVSDTNTRRIYRPKSLTGAKDLTKNAEVVAGTGEQCLPFDEARCGDGGKAVEATLMSPKEMGFHHVDRAVLKVLSSGSPPALASQSARITGVRLEWPTDLAINPMDNSIYVLDNNVVLQITENRQVRIAAGRPMHCQVPGVEYPVGKHAVQTTLESATAIAVSYSGVLYITETDEKKINRIRQVTTDGEISLVAGIPSECDCKNDANCDCYQSGDGYAKDAKLSAPSSLAASPDGTLYIADLGNIRIRAVSKNKPLLNSMNFYEVASPTDQELYIFDINGTHQYTVSLVTGDYLYNFSYSNDNDITAVTDSNGNTLRIRRDPNRMPVRVVSPDNQSTMRLCVYFRPYKGQLVLGYM
ncbi:Teneurin-3 [Plecturocebus cupreus]